MAYVDDSGSDPTSHVFVLAGFVSTAPRWRAFSNEWDAICAEPPAIDDFKMRLAHRLKGPGTYWGMGTDDELVHRRDDRLLKLARTISNHAMFSLHCSMA